MRAAIGFLIILWGLSHFFSQSFSQTDQTGETVLRAIERSAELSLEHIEQ